MEPKRKTAGGPLVLSLPMADAKLSAIAVRDIGDSESDFGSDFNSDSEPEPEPTPAPSKAARKGKKRA